MPILTGVATDLIINAHKYNYPFSYSVQMFLAFGVLIIVVTLIGGFFMFLMRQAIIVMSRLIEYDLKNELFSHYQSLDMAFYRRNNTGDLMNRISEDVSRVRMYIGPAVMYFANTLTTLILVSSAMAMVSIKLTLYVLFPLPILVVVIYFVSDLINRMSNKVQEQLSKLSTIAQETFSGIRVLKAYAQEEPTGNYFASESGVYRKRYLGLIMTEGLFSPLILLLMGLSTLLTIYIGGKQAIDGQITYGNIVEFIIYVGKLTWPVASLGWVTSLVQRAAASQKRNNEFLNTHPSLISPKEIGLSVKVLPLGEDLGGVSGNIEFKNVAFVYPDSGIKAIDNISFQVQSGKSLAIIGKTGSGKSSVASLICRMYDVSEGKILVDGKNLKEWNLHSVRKQIGYVPQDTFLFSDTVENNIAFGVGQGKSNIEQVEQAAKDAGIFSEINRFPEKFKTMIGERGITLSGGQKQRIAIARAIIGSPQILIFDDCLSAVDTETEAEILGSLRKLMSGKTTILISHRVSTVKDASHIIALEHGRIKEEGTHQQLMDKKGYYFELYKMQMAEDEMKDAVQP